MQYTDQQDRIIQRGVAGDSFKIQALAGTGKTSTLVAMALAISGRRGRYLAFNKAIAREAQSKFGSNVKAGTMHALAFGKVGRLYRHARNTPSKPPYWVEMDSAASGRAPCALHSYI